MDDKKNQNGQDSQNIQKEETKKQKNRGKNITDIKGVLFWLLIAFIIIVPIGILFFLSYNNNIQVLSSEDFNEIFVDLKTFDEANLPSKQLQKDDLIKKIDNLLIDFPNTKSAERALFYKGYVFYYCEEYDKAQNNFVDFLKKYPKSYLAPKAYYFLSYCYLNNDKIDLAIDTLKKILNLKDTYYASLAYYRIGELYELKGEVDKAIDSYTVLTEKYSNSSQAENAKNKLFILKNNVKL